ncbi:MAG: KH domain-containing protein [Patescibacteria group bacterium]|nr:KH domain-containing protein [Patescibacteria group bacterium]
MENADKQFLEMIVKNIVSNPEDVNVERTVDEMGVLLTLKINPADMGYVIGRKGQTAQAIRTLLKIVGAKNNSRVNLKIFDPEGGARRTSRPTEGAQSNQSADLSDVDTSALDDLKI